MSEQQTQTHVAACSANHGGECDCEAPPQHKMPTVNTDDDGELPERWDGMS